MSNQTTKQNFKPTINKSAKQLVMKNAQQNAAGSSEPSADAVTEPAMTSPVKQPSRQEPQKKYTSSNNIKPSYNNQSKKQPPAKQTGKMTQKQRDDALFEALGKNKKKKKRKILITAISIGLVVVLVLVVGLNALKYQVRNHSVFSLSWDVG